MIAPLAGTTAARAEVTQFETRAAMEAAIPGLVTEDFEDAVGGPDGSLTDCSSDPINASSNAVCVAPGQIAAGLTIGSSKKFGASTIAIIGKGWMANTSKLVSTYYLDDDLVLTFDPPVPAVGFDLASLRPAQTCRVDVVSQTGALVSVEKQCPQSGSFVGFVSETPIYRISLVDNVTVGGNPEMADNISFGKVPSTLTAEPAILDGTSPTLMFRAKLDSFFGPLAGQAVKFMAGSDELCTGTTDASGVASCGGATDVISAVPSLGYTAVYEGSAIVAGSQGSGALVG